MYNLQMLTTAITLFLFVGCREAGNNVSNVLLNEKDLIPEGTAYNETKGSIYIGSIYRQKVVEINGEGNVNDLISKDHFGILSPLGMEFEADRNTLWVNLALAPIINQSSQTQWKTGLMSYNLSNGESKQYHLKDSLKSFFNDLTLLRNGDVMITETANGRIFKFNRKQNRFELFIQLNDFTFPNGITSAEEEDLLFVATDQGIIKIKISSKGIELLETDHDIDASTIDGLSIHKDYFIGHQSTKISKFFFDVNYKIHDVETFDSGKKFDSSTTGEIGNGSYHYIVNSQIRSGIENSRIKPIDSLETIIIRSRTLE